jgi:hypothetical protein
MMLLLPYRYAVEPVPLSRLPSRGGLHRTTIAADLMFSPFRGIPFRGIDELSPLIMLLGIERHTAAVSIDCHQNTPALLPSM